MKPKYKKRNAVLIKQLEEILDMQAIREKNAALLEALTSDEASEENLHEKLDA